MKPVTPSTVRTRIEQLQRARINVGLSLAEEFELRCLVTLFGFMTDGGEV